MNLEVNCDDFNLRVNLNKSKTVVKRQGGKLKINIGNWYFKRKYQNWLVRTSI